MSIFETMRVCCVIYLLCVWCSHVFGQMPLSEHFNDQHGLHSNTIYSLFQDSNGYLWVGTDKGVMRFNGENFEEIMHQRDYPLLEVYSIKEDQQGKIWFSTRDCRLYSFSGHNVKPYRYNHLIDSVRPERSLYISDWRISPDKMELSILGRSSFSISDDGEVAMLGNRNFNFSVGDKGTLLEIVPHEKTCLLAGEFPIDLTRGSSKLSGIFSVPEDIYTCDLRRLHDSPTPVFTAGEMIYRFNEDTCFSFQASAPITALAEDGYGNIWVGLFKGGVLKLNKNLEPGGKHSSQFEGYTVSALLMDRYDQMWVGTPSQGLFKVGNQRILSFAREDELDAVTVGLIANRDALTAVFQGGRIYQFDFNSGATRQFHTSDFAKMNGVRNVVLDKLNRLWILSIGSGRVAIIDEDGKGESIAPQRPYIGRYLANIDDRIWAFGGGGPNQISDITDKNPIPILEISEERKADLNLIGMLIRDIHSIDESRKLLATNRGLLEMVDGEIKSLEGEFGTEPAQEIHGIVDVGDGYAFYNTTQGVFGEYKGKAFAINHSNGLVSNFIISMHADENRLFIGSSEGLQSVSLESLGNTPRIHTVLGNCKVRQLAQALGCLWVGTESGVVCISDTASFQIGQKPLLFALGEEQDAQDQSHEKQHEFSRNDQNIEFAFEAVDIAQFGPFHFEYKIEPVHTQWQQNSTGNIQLSGLGEGEYELKVRAHHGHHIYSDVESVEFRVLPFFMFSWWFLLIVVLVLAIAMWIFVVYTRRREKRRLSARNRMAMLTQQATSARMDPHFIFKSLNSLKFFIKTKDLENASRYLNDFAKLMRSNIEYAKDDFIGIWREKELLTNYVKLENMRMGDTLDFDIEIDPSLDPDLKIPAMILQPLLENAIWHGLGTKEGSREIQVVGKSLNQELIFIIDDNGVGRQVASTLNNSDPAKRERHSLDFINERLTLLSQIHGKDFALSIKDKVNVDNKPTGTTCEIRFPIMKEADLILEEV